MNRLSLVAAAFLLTPIVQAQQVSSPAGTNPIDTASTRQPFELGVLVQGGTGITDQRDGFKFLSAGVHAGRILTGNFGPGPLRGNFEYAVEAFPFWQSYTPKFQKVDCTQAANSALINCSQPYTVGGTYTGASITPIIIRWNFARHGRFTPWAQAAGGVLWTNHKYPAYGDTTTNLNTNGPNGDASVWNFTPQGGVGFHYFTRPNRSVDFSANAVHISSASLGDRNPGVNVSLQFTLGYTWWK
ncbi:acyloxyacyl hydrolase [Granulicella sp. WH15]|uniref:acyloxyacyl hydrolase n=1 Tax=Granulicella sp. WH15 TaxID=2602070 RepID=UPI001367207A|nr:acyloxyacyl hydrolase [Granulicella sp. WH15]QHN03129.1 acyloxyacyl hydrolase [Granulicella sp. WH15]